MERRVVAGDDFRDYGSDGRIHSWVEQRMGICVSNWNGSNFAVAIQRLPDVFQERTGLVIQIKACGRALDGSTSAWSLSVPQLQLRAWVDLYLEPTSELPGQRVVGEWIMPLHPYVWHQLQASLAELGFRSTRVRPTWQLPEQTVPPRWNRRWSQLSRLRRAVYGRPDLWPLWFF